MENLGVPLRFALRGYPWNIAIEDQNHIGSPDTLVATISETQPSRMCTWKAHVRSTFDQVSTVSYPKDKDAQSHLYPVLAVLSHWLRVEPMPQDNYDFVHCIP